MPIDAQDDWEDQTFAIDLMVEHMKARGMPLTIVDRPEAEIRDLYEADLALIRPDQIVAWRGDRVPDDPAALLARLTGG